MSPNLLKNGGFEGVSSDGSPVGWILADGHKAGALTEEQPHGGQRAGRITADGQARAWRQEVPGPATRLYTATGWFRAQGVKMAATRPDEEYARFYFHILYKDRPYSDTTHAYVDIPTGTYDWKPIAVRLVPQTQWPIDKIRVTVATRLSAGTLDFDDLALTVALPRGGSAAMEWANGLKPILLTDMARCQPSEALSPTAKRGRWKVIEYETGAMKGKMLWASVEANAPPLTLPLDVRGWHAIYVGLADPASLGCKALLRLTSDPAFVPRGRSAGQIEETFLKVADVTGQSLHIAQASSGHASGCGVAYVKLVPLVPEEAAAVQADRRAPAHRRLATTIDGFSFIYSRRPTTAEALLEEVEVYRDSDFDTLVLQMGGADMVNYPSQSGEMRGRDLEVFDRDGDRFYAEAIRELAAKGINPTKVLIDGAHGVGLKVHVAVRPAAWVHSEPLSEFFNSRFYQEHPEWRCVDRDGTAVARMSLAVPQVRAHLVEVLREAVRLGADGACVLFNRGVPLVLFEKPFCDLFRQRFGIEATSVDESDPRVLQLRAETLTAFMRETRTMLDAEGQRRGGQRLQLSVFVLADEADNVKFGLDVRRWVADGLVDELFPYLRAGGTTARGYDMKFFKDICQTRTVPVRPSFIGWKTPDLAALMREAVALYDQGADGITFWDGNSGAERTDRWSVVSRLGHVAELRQRALEGPPSPVTLRFHKLGGVIMDGRYSPNWGF
ncbi:MAG: hypothetical protein FJ279_06255 [Planctomycetes bacterium]|nr:hypothetical protein [Planctomycetota bacterium]